MCREDGKWIASAESRSVRVTSHQPIFMGDCPTICHMYLACLPGEWVSFCVPGAIARELPAGSIVVVTASSLKEPNVLVLVAIKPDEASGS